MCGCSKFYSNEKFNFKCSECYGLFDKTNYIEKENFITKCNEWVQANTVQNSKIIGLLKRAGASTGNELMFNIISYVKEEKGLYISSDLGLELYKMNPTQQRGHIVASFIADWWNINSKLTEWPAYLSCYYGNFNESLEVCFMDNRRNIPPRLPHSRLQ